MARYTVTKYSFQPPEEISEMEYYSYLQMLKVNPNSNLYYQEKKPVGRKILKWTALSLIAPLAPAAFIGEVESSASKSNAENAKRDYFYDLKELLIQSRNYDNFKEKYEQYYLDYLRIHFPIEYQSKVMVKNYFKR